MLLTATLAADYVHIWSDDPALDTQADGHDHAKFLETGDRSFLKLKPGEEPMVWTLAHLRGAALAAARGEVGACQLDPARTPSGLMKLAGLALRSCANVLADGTPFEIDVVTAHNGIQHMRQSQLELLYSCAPTLVEEIGNRVLTEDLNGNPT